MCFFPGGPSKSDSALPPPSWPPVYPAAHPLPNSAAALPLGQQVKWWKPASSRSLGVFLAATAYLRSASVLAYCLLLLLEPWLLPEQPNKPVIRRRAVCKRSCGQPKHGPGFYGRAEVLQSLLCSSCFISFCSADSQASRLIRCIHGVLYVLVLPPLSPLCLQNVWCFVAPGSIYTPCYPWAKLSWQESRSGCCLGKNVHPGAPWRARHRCLEEWAVCVQKLVM